MSCDTRELLSRLYAARRASRVYPPGHPVPHEAVIGLAESIDECIRDGGDVELGFRGGEVSFGGEALPSESVIFEQMIRDMASIGANSVIFRQGVVAEEIERAVGVLSAHAATAEAAGGIGALSRAARLADVEITGQGGAHLNSGVVEGSIGEARRIYDGAVSLMRGLDQLIHSDPGAASSQVEQIVDALVEQVLDDPSRTLLLVGMNGTEDYTPHHSANVAVLSLVLGAAISTNRRFLNCLAAGALLHDVGMLAIDREVLARPGILDPDEWEAVRRHPLTSARLVSRVEGLDKSALVTVLEHHMRYDLNGYPVRVPRRKLHVTSRIVAIADSYDAMTSERSYSAARTPDRAMAVLASEAGAGLDPELVQLFIRVLGVYPPRATVRLSTDEVGIVVRVTGQPTRPVVRVIKDPTGASIEPKDIDLATETGVSVQGCIDPRTADIDADEHI